MIKEIIVVEGRDDVTAVKRALDAELITTGGFGFPKGVMERIKAAQKRRGVIIITDPDIERDKIRKKISQDVQGYKKELLKKEEIHKAEETIRKEKDEEIAALQKQLFDMQTRQLSDQAAIQEAKTALLSLRLELSQAHQKELNEVRIEKDKKIEALQNE